MNELVNYFISPTAPDIVPWLIGGAFLALMGIYALAGWLSWLNIGTFDEV